MTLFESVSGVNVVTFELPTTDHSGHRRLIQMFFDEGSLVLRSALLLVGSGDDMWRYAAFDIPVALLDGMMHTLLCADLLQEVE